MVDFAFAKSSIDYSGPSRTPVPTNVFVAKVGKETKVSRVESEVLQKKTIKFQKVGVLEGKSRSAKASLYKCTAVRATREENEIFKKRRKPKVFNKRKNVFGRDLFAL